MGDLELPFGEKKISLGLIQKGLRKILSANKFPILLGGDHLITLPIVEELVHIYPDLHLIHIDARTDLREDYLGESLSHSTVMRKVVDCLGKGRLRQIGIRSGTKEEFDLARRLKSIVSLDQASLASMVKHLRSKPVYISLTAKGATEHDLKEFWHVGRELPPGHRYQRFMPDNLWIDGIPGFRESTLALWDAFDALGRELLAAIAQHLGLPRRWFDGKVAEGNSVLRVIHYPPVARGAGGVRAAAHEDINAITLLLGAEEAGLQVLGRDGRWLDINPAPGTLVCNIGDMLQRLTNGVLPSTTHRVVNPAEDRAGRPRYSMPFFLHFNPDFEIRSLPACVGPGRPDRYPVPITADEYLRQRLREIRLM